MQNSKGLQLCAVEGNWKADQGTGKVNVNNNFMIITWEKYKSNLKGMRSSIFKVNIVACVAGKSLWVFLFTSLAGIPGWHGVTHGNLGAGEALALY